MISLYINLAILISFFLLLLFNLFELRKFFRLFFLFFALLLLLVWNICLFFHLGRMFFIIFLEWFLRGRYSVLFYFLLCWILLWRCWCLLNLWSTFTFLSLSNTIYFFRRWDSSVFFILQLIITILFRWYFLFNLCWLSFSSPYIVLRYFFNIEVKVVITANSEPKLSLLLDDLQFLLSHLPHHLVVRLSPFFFEGLYLRYKQYSSDVSANFIYVL